jgi:hypothetical protein
MHIAQAGFPGHLSSYRFFRTRNRGVLILGDEFMSPCPSIALDPDQPLDDFLNGIKLREPALGDYATA